MDFILDYSDKDVLLADPDARELRDDFAGVDNFTDEELQQAIVQDVLMATMWEIQFEATLDFSVSELLRFVPSDKHLRVLGELKSNALKPFLVFGGNQSDPQIRIKKDDEVLQAAMDFCGCWYEGFDMPEGTIVVNRDCMGEMKNLDTLKGVDNFINSQAEKIASMVNEVMSQTAEQPRYRAFLEQIADMNRRANVPFNDTYH